MAGKIANRISDTRLGDPVQWEQDQCYPARNPQIDMCFILLPGRLKLLIPVEPFGDPAGGHDPDHSRAEPTHVRAAFVNTAVRLKIAHQSEESRKDQRQTKINRPKVDKDHQQKQQKWYRQTEIKSLSSIGYAG